MTASQVNAERQARYQWAAGLVAGGSVLDAACGVGWGTAVLARTASAATGVDISPAAIADAQREHADVAQFQEGDLQDLPFAEDEFDHVVCFEALAHVAEPAQVVDELCRVLRPGGMLLISCPNRDGYPPGNPLHLSALSSEELERVLAARFANVAVHRQQSYHASLLTSADLLAHNDPATPIEVTVTKLSGGAPGSELHAVAVASDGLLPAQPAELALGDFVDFDEQQALLREWQERAVKAEATALAHARKLRSR